MQPVTTTLPAWYVPTVCRFLSGVAGARLETRLVVVAVPCGLSTPPPLTHTHAGHARTHTHERGGGGGGGGGLCSGIMVGTAILNTRSTAGLLWIDPLDSREPLLQHESELRSRVFLGRLHGVSKSRETNSTLVVKAILIFVA